MKVSFVIPSYKSSKILEEQLPILLNYLNTNSIKNEVIIVDDGSDDDGLTKAVVERLNCVFVQNPTNTGKGGAVKLGMSKATGAIRIFTDADIPFEPSSIQKIVDNILVKGYDVVIGDRTLPESKYFQEVSGKRKMGSSFFTFIVGRFITTGVFDTQCGLKGFKGEVANDLFSKARIKSFAFDVELIYISLKRNYDIKKIPVSLRYNETSTVNFMKHAPGMVLDLFKIKINHLMGKYKKSNE